MPIKKVAICDKCGKQEDLDTAINGDRWLGKKAKWFIVNIAHVYCSEVCWLTNKRE